jgi:hypothetical protein
MNSDTEADSTAPLQQATNDTSVTPAIGDSINGGLISMSRILKGLISGI